MVDRRRPAVELDGASERVFGRHVSDDRQRQRGRTERAAERREVGARGPTLSTVPARRP
jgi:hypothetical protein